MKGFNFVILPTAGPLGNPIPESELEPWYNSARAAFANAFGGYTESEALGGWVAGSGFTVSEPVRILEAFGDDKPEVRARVAQTLKAGLGQAAVMVGFKPGSAEFI